MYKDLKPNNDWKKSNDDPPPTSDKDFYNSYGEYYPKNNYKSAQDHKIMKEYESLEKLFFKISQITVSNILFFFLKKRKIVKLPLIFAYNSILIVSLQKILKYYKPSKNINGQYPMRLIGSIFQKYISTPSIFRGSLKDKYFPQHRIFNENYEIIKEEIQGLLKYSNKMQLTHNAIPYNNYISRDYDENTGKGWKTCVIKIEGKLTEIGKLHCPKLSTLVDIPIIRNATVSILEGKRHIPIHCGYFKGYIRYLFCVIEPKKKHSFIYINKEKYIFKENEGILWDDLFPHEVYNMSDDYRVCIYLDILRKLDNKVLNFLFNKLINITKYSKAVSKINSTYEKKPISLDEFPNYNE